MTERAGEVVTEEVTVKEVWRCEHNGEIYVSPRCSFGAEHRRVRITITTRTEVVDVD